MKILILILLSILLFIPLCLRIIIEIIDVFEIYKYFEYRSQKWNIKYKNNKFMMNWLKNDDHNENIEKQEDRLDNDYKKLVESWTK